MTQDEIKKVLIESIAEHFGLIKSELNADTILFSSTLLSSVQLIQMVLLLEESFKIAIPSFEVGLETFDTIDAMSAYVAGKLSKPSI